MPSVRIEVVSDVMCPWCYIGKRRLEKALESLGGSQTVDVRWRPFQLDPTLPKEGKDRRAYLEDKFGGPERAGEIYARIGQAGEAEGIPFDFNAIAVSANTLDAHRLIRWAGETGPETEERVVETLFRMYFTEGRNVGDNEVLAQAAGEAGMDREAIRARLESGEDRAAVEIEIHEARRMGVDGVPCFILDRKYAVSGAQSPETLSAAIRQVAAEREKAAG